MGVDYYLANTATGYRNVGAVIILRRLIFAEDEARLLISAARTPADLTAMVGRRATGQPLEHVLGWVEFCGLRIAVDAGVFVPHRRTELLVRQATALVRLASTAGQPLVQPRPVVVDLCCGSGAVGAALVAALERVELYAVDVDPAAVRCARRNVSLVVRCTKVTSTSRCR